MSSSRIVVDKALPAMRRYEAELLAKAFALWQVLGREYAYARVRRVRLWREFMYTLFATQRALRRRAAWLYLRRRERRAAELAQHFNVTRELPVVDRQHRQQFSGGIRVVTARWHPVVDIVAIAEALDEPGVAELFQVLGNARLALHHDLGQFGEKEVRCHYERRTSRNLYAPPIA